MTQTTLIHSTHTEPLAEETYNKLTKLIDLTSESTTSYLRTMKTERKKYPSIFKALALFKQEPVIIGHEDSLLHQIETMQKNHNDNKNKKIALNLLEDEHGRFLQKNNDLENVLSFFQPLLDEITSFLSIDILDPNRKQELSASLLLLQTYQQHLLSIRKENKLFAKRIAYVL